MNMTVGRGLDDQIDPSSLSGDVENGGFNLRERFRIIRMTTQFSTLSTNSTSNSTNATTLIPTMILSHSSNYILYGFIGCVGLVVFIVIIGARLSKCKCKCSGCVKQPRSPKSEERGKIKESIEYLQEFKRLQNQEKDGLRRVSIGKERKAIGRNSIVGIARRIVKNKSRSLKSIKTKTFYDYVITEEKPENNRNKDGDRALHRRVTGFVCEKEEWATMDNNKNAQELESTAGICNDACVNETNNLVEDGHSDDEEETVSWSISEDDDDA